jgi:hypothetical protein
MNISETEIQILASLSKLEAESSLTDQKSIEARGVGYWIFKEDWEGAFEKLLAKKYNRRRRERLPINQCRAPIIGE